MAQRASFQAANQHRSDVLLQSSGAIGLDLRLSRRFRVLLDTSTSVTIANGLVNVNQRAAVVEVLLIVTQDAAGGHTITWPSSVTWLSGYDPQQPNPHSTSVYRLISWDGIDWMAQRVWYSDSSPVEYGVVRKAGGESFLDHGMLAWTNLTLDHDVATVHRAQMAGEVPVHFAGSRDESTSYVQELDLRLLGGDAKWPPYLTWLSGPDLVDRRWHRIQFRVDGGIAGGGIADITRSYPATVTTATPHGRTNDFRVALYDTIGMPELDGLRFYATVTGPSTFSIDIDSSSFGVYMSGGSWHTEIDAYQLAEASPDSSTEGVTVSFLSSQSDAMKKGTPVALYGGMMKRASASPPLNECFGLVLDDEVTVGAVGRVQIANILEQPAVEWDHVTDTVGGLVPEANYFVDSTGRLTTLSDAIAGQYIVPVGYALSSTKMMISLGTQILL